MKTAASASGRKEAERNFEKRDPGVQTRYEEFGASFSGVGTYSFPSNNSGASGSQSSSAEDGLSKQFSASFSGVGTTYISTSNGTAPSGLGGFQPSSAQDVFKKAFPSTVSRTLPVSLEELQNGATKKLRVERQILDASGRPTATEKVLEVHIKPGYKAGTKIKVAEAGDELPDGRFQSIEFVLQEMPHARFKGDGDNLRADVEISLKEALLGYEREIELLDGRRRRIANHGTVVHTGQELVVSGEGMPARKAPGRKGDLIVTFKVVLPRNLTQVQKAQLNALLPD